MSTHRVHVFISHSWSYSDHYDTLRAWIFDNRWAIDGVSLRFSDYSVPRQDPILHAPTEGELQEAIYRKIARSHVVVCPTGMYAHHSKWIQKEIAGALQKDKVILGVDPWGQRRRASVVGNAAQETVRWNQKSVLRGIWKCYVARQRRPRRLERFAQLQADTEPRRA